MDGSRVPRIEDAQTSILKATVPSRILENFRRAIFARHGTTYDRLSLEVTRALAAHTDVLFAEARSVQPQAQVQDDEYEPDPFMRCLHYGGKDKGGEPSSEPDVRVL